MSTDGDAFAHLRAQLDEFVATQFEASASNEAVRREVLAHPALAVLDRPQLEAALEQVLALRSPEAEPEAGPRLLVDWGELPQVGRAARPLFSLVTEPSFGRPNVRVAIDRSLDNDPLDPLRQLRSDEPGIWTFYVPFSLTSNGLDARPGLYVIDVEVNFPHVQAGRPRFLQTRIRLSIPSDGEGQRELVIDGDGQSVVNLAGHDLRSFSRVVLKGDDKSIINLQNFSQEQPAAAPPEQAVVFEYQLKVNHHIQQRLPTPVLVPDPSKADAITLVAGNRRIHVIARRRATFGRSRDNDICLRFLPRSEQHDQGSRGISRTHLSVELTDDGVVLTDEQSAKGVDVDCDPIKGDKTLTYLDCLSSRHLDLPSPLAADVSLEMELMAFGRDPDDPHSREQLDWDDICFDVAGEPASRLWQVAKSCGVETLRLRRLNNLPDEEYVFLYRHAVIGRSAKDHAIVVPGVAASGGELRLIYAGRMFWLHSDGHETIAVDGKPVAGACMIPLQFGNVLTLGSSTVHVARMAQFHLDDDPVLSPAPADSTLNQDATSPVAGGPVMPRTPAGAVSPPPLPPAIPVKAMGAAPSPPPVPAPLDDEPPAVSDRGGASQSSTDPIQAALHSVAVIGCREGHGSGFVPAPGLLVTNYHVIADDRIEDLTATFFDPQTHASRSYPVSLISEDPSTDLAILSVAADVPSLAVRQQFRHQNGHRIAIIGSPGVGNSGERLENIVTDGRLGPAYSTSPREPRWSLSVTLNPGNSGGPVLDAATGDVLGVAVAKFTTADGLALAIPHDAMESSLRLAVSQSPADAERASSLHRQRYCLRALATFSAGAFLAIEDVLSMRDAALGEVSLTSANSIIGHQAEPLSAALATALEALTTHVAPELERLREDAWCSDPIRHDFRSIWEALQPAHALIEAASGGRTTTAALERLATSLSDLEPVFESIRDALDGSLLSGSSVFEAGEDNAAPLSDFAAMPVRAAPGFLGRSPLAKLFQQPHGKPRYLTKSRFTLACSCPTKLFYTSKAGEYANTYTGDPTMESLANEGNRVGALARLYFPEGVLVDTLNHESALAQTNELLRKAEITIFEAAIRFGDFFIRADILRKTPAGFDLIEVKSKGYLESHDGNFTTNAGIAASWLPYIRDVAFQKHVLAGAFPESTSRAYLFLPDKSATAISDTLAARCAAAVEGRAAVLSNDERAAPLMRLVSVESQCVSVLSDAYTLGDRRLSFGDFAATLAEHYRDDIKLQAELSPACLKCEFDASAFQLALGEKSGRRECWQTLLGWDHDDFEKPAAFDICGLSAAKKQTLLNERRLHLTDVRESDINPMPDEKPGLSLSQRQWLQVTKSVNSDSSPFLDRNGLRQEMASWRYPLHLIDFETCRAAIPFHRGSRPLDLVAFQFSHHVLHADGTLEHAGEYLSAEPGRNPNAAFVRELSVQLSGDNGTLLHYAPHEISTLRALAGQLRASGSDVHDAENLLAFIDSIAPPADRKASRQAVDLCQLVKRYYYSPSMGGSNSIKEVLPAVLHESEYLRSKYSQPIYGSPGGIRSRNFSGIAWVTQRDGSIRNPYLLLPAISAAANDRNDRNEGPGLQSIRNGGAAMQAYADLVLNEWTPIRRGEVESALLRYCELNTLAMAFIVEAWREWCR